MEQQKKINEALQEVRVSNRSGSHINCIRLSKNKFHHQHNLEVIKRCLEYLYIGTPFLTEAIFNNGSRADILLPSIPEIEEIMITETEEYFDTKNYPFPIKQIKVKPKGINRTKIETIDSDISLENWKDGKGINLCIRKPNNSNLLALSRDSFNQLKQKINEFEVK